MAYLRPWPRCPMASARPLLGTKAPRWPATTRSPTCSAKGVFFADAGRPWQRGSNENTNGLLRQYFPKGTDLGVHSSDHLAAVAQRLNTRPRKRLGWRTPAEVLAAHLLL